MSTINLRGARAYIFIGVLAAAAYAATSNADEMARPEVIVHPGVSQQTLSVKTLRAIFGMRLHSWPDGTSVKVFVLGDEHPLHQSFSKGVLNIFPYRLRAAWERLIYSGTGQAPSEVSSEQEMRARIAETPGAIGYLGGGMVDDSIYVLRIE